MSATLVQVAAKAWEVENEDLDAVNRRIHDGVKEAVELQHRADKYVDQLFNRFNYVNWDIETALEIGSGTGFIMEALERRTRPAGNGRKIIGLDISNSMIAKARERLRNSPYLQSGLFDFALYDGVNVPFPADHFDLIYSVAALQHIPKPYVYNLFFEIKRILKPRGTAILHFLPFSSLERQEKMIPWKVEIEQQIGLRPGRHWHHFYSEEELDAVLRVTGFQHIHLTPGIYACIRRTQLSLPDSFNPESYLKKNPDVRGKMKPEDHWLRYGFRERRQW
jgi:ubiquinone/menaquinone biosynthesis C-methylase UbiE